MQVEILRDDRSRIATCSRSGTGSASIVVGYLAIWITTALVRRSRHGRMSALGLACRASLLGGIGAIGRFLLDALDQRSRRKRLSARHPRGQRQRRVRCSGCLPGWRSNGDALRARRDRDARLLHDLFDLDARDPPPRRGRRVRARRGLNALLSLARRCRCGGAGARDRSASCERRLPEAHDLLRRARPQARTACCPTSCWTSTADTGVRASVLLRGAEGFGRRQHLHTDRLLSLSEDLPVVSVAVDRRERIESMLERGPADQAPRLDHARARAPARRRARAGASCRTQLVEATKLTVYVGRQERVCRRAGLRRGLRAAAAPRDRRRDRPARRRRHQPRPPRRRARFFGRNADVPVMIIAVGAGERIAAVLPELGGLLQRAARDARARARLQARGRAAGDTARAARHRRAWAGDVAEADDLHLARRDARGPARCTWRSSAGCAHRTARGCHLPTRDLWGFHGEHRSRTATDCSKSAATSPADDHDRYARANGALVCRSSTS